MTDRAIPGPVWYIEVAAPKDKVSYDDFHELQSRIADVAHDWEPDERDEWDIDVTGGVAYNGGWNSNHLVVLREALEEIGLAWQPSVEELTSILNKLGAVGF